MVFIKSILCVSILVLVTWSQCAPTDQDPPTNEDFVMGFKITEKYKDKSDTKKLLCFENSEPQGTHPHPKEACEDVKEILTHPKDPPNDEDCICPDIFDPVDLTLSLHFPKNPKWYNTTVQFANPCMYYCQTDIAPHFVDIGVVPPQQQNEETN